MLNPQFIDLTEEEDIDPFLYNDPTENQIIIENVFSSYEPDIKDNDLEVNNSPIKLKREDILALYSLIAPIEFNLRFIYDSANYAPYTFDFIIGIVKEWWCQRQENDPAFITDRWTNNFPIMSNEWLFSFLNCLPQRQRHYMLETYFRNKIDDSAHIETHNDFTLTSIRKKNYVSTINERSIIRVGEFMTDLKKVICQIDITPPLILMKVRDPSYRRAQLVMTTAQQLKHKLMTINVGKVTADKILNTGMNKNFIMYEQLTFFPGRENAFTFFQGFEYFPVPQREIKMELIQPFLTHIEQVICNKRHEIYEYVINWISFIVQKVGQKTKTSIIITGIQGTGKNTFTDTICNLFGSYANKNCKLEHITGDFNSSIMYKMLLVCNEVKSFINNKKYDPEMLKTLITEDSIDIHKKFHDVFTQQNVANFIFLSNNFAPLKIEEDDRRFLVMETSSEKRGDHEYFSQLHRSFTPEFYSNLLAFFGYHDISLFDPSVIPLTNEKTDIINFFKNPYFMFIQKNLIQFKKGFPRKTVFETYKMWCTEIGFAPGTQQKFRISVLKYCREKRILGSQEECYQLKNEMIELFTNKNK